VWEEFAVKGLEAGRADGAGIEGTGDNATVADGREQPGSSQRENVSSGTPTETEAVEGVMLDASRARSSSPSHSTGRSSTLSPPPDSPITANSSASSVADDRQLIDEV